MPRSFQPLLASLQGVGPLVLVEDTNDLPIRRMVVTSYVDVPADWRGPSLERHLAQMQDAAVADLATQGWAYDGGAFTFRHPFTQARKSIPGGFAVCRTGVVTHATGEGEVGHIEYADSGTPLKSGTVRYLLAAVYRRRLWKTEIIMPEEQASGGFIR